MDVITGLRSPWSKEIVHVWGLGNSEGHIYVSKDEEDRQSNEIKSKADARRADRTRRGRLKDLLFLPFIRVLILVPV